MVDVDDVARVTDIAANDTNSLQKHAYIHYPLIYNLILNPEYQTHHTMPVLVQFKTVPSFLLRRFVCTTVPGETLKFGNQSLFTGTSTSSRSIF